MIRRFVILPLASVLVGALLLTVFGAGHVLVRHEQAASGAQRASVDLLRQAGLLRAFGQLARLGVDRHELLAAGHRLGISRRDAQGLVHSVRQVGDVPAAGAVGDTVDGLRGRSVVGVSVLGVLLAGLVGFPVVAGLLLPLRRLQRRLGGSRP